MINLAYNLGLLAILSVVSGFVNSHWKRDTQAGALLQGLVFGSTATLGLLRPHFFASGVIFESGSGIAAGNLPGSARL